MFNIRQNVFETNSSSTHALCWTEYDKWYDSKDGKLFIKEYYKDYSIDIKGDYYGREFRQIDDTIKAKLNYLWTAIIDTYFDYSYKTNSYIETPEAKDAIQKLNKIFPNVNFILPGRYINVGIDHGYQLKNFLDFIFNDEEMLKSFIYDGSIYLLGEWCDLLSFIPEIEDDTVKCINKRYIYLKGN